MLTIPTDLHPNQVAFLGECEASAGDRSPGAGPRFVHALCWSRTPEGWAALAKPWSSMKAYRDEDTSSFNIHKGQPLATSWICATAPSLGALFVNNPAEESTLASWISRAQISIALAIVQDDRQATNASELPNYRESVHECLSDYLEFLKSPGYQPVRLVLTASHPSDRNAALADAFADAQERLPTSSSLGRIQLRSCAPGEDLLPLDLTNLVSAAVLRYLGDPTASNPIFDAARSKFVRVPRDIGPLRNSKHR